MCLPESLLRLRVPRSRKLLRHPETRIRSRDASAKGVGAAHTGKLVSISRPPQRAPGPRGATRGATAARRALPKQPAVAPWSAMRRAPAAPPVPLLLLLVLGAAVEAKARPARRVMHIRTSVGLFNHLTAAGTRAPGLGSGQRTESRRTILIRRRRLSNEARGIVVPSRRTPDAGVGAAEGTLHLVIGVVAVLHRRRTDGGGGSARPRRRPGPLTATVVVRVVCRGSRTGRACGARTTGATGTASRSPRRAARPPSPQLKVKRHSACGV